MYVREARFFTCLSIASAHDEPALLSRTFESVTFQDPTPDHARTYLHRKLADIDIPNKDRALAHAATILGGRFTDLSMFTAKVRSGVSADAAMEEILLRAVVEVRKYGLGQEIGSQSAEREERKREWTTVQFWHVLKEIVGKEEVGVTCVCVCV